MLRRTRATKNYKEASTEDDSDDGQNNEREESDEWLPTEGRLIEGTQNVDNKTAENKKTTTVKRLTKPKEPKPKLERKPRAARVPKAIKKPTTKQETADTPADSVEVKQERLSIGVNMQLSSNSTLPGDMPDEGTSQRHNTTTVKKEEPEDSFTFEDPPQKKQKISSAACGRPIKSKLNQCIEDLQMNWDPIQVLAQKTGVELWVCANITQLFQEENTIPFMVRYRKELINHMDADSVRDVQLVLEEIRGVSKKCRTVAQTLKKEGVLTSELERLLKNCTTADEIDHLYTPYKKGSKLTKARQAKELGLEPAAQALLQAPQTLNMNSFIQPNKNGLSSQQEVATGVQEILTDMIAKDKETLSHVQYLCDQADVTIHSTVSKTALKDKEQQTNQKSKAKDISKFSLYTDFTCSVQRIQHHQTLAINRGENLKILTVKVNVPDRVKNDFCRWCINVRWRPQGFAQPDLMVILKNAAEDSFKRFIMPFLSRRIRTKLTTSAEKESIAMFVRNLRQRLLVCPVRGKIIMGIDPGFHHGCKLAVLSSTSQILQTDVVYLHGSTKQREAEKLRHILAKHSCETIVIGNGKGCRETEAFITDLIKQEFFKPLDVSYCITNEAGASIYSVSSEAVKEMPDLDPNVRSAVSIGRRVQDPLAELIKIDPKHIGIGTYQHDVSQSLLRAALDGVVQECVSFVGVDINICSETLMRHVAGLNAGRARGIMEWKEKNGPFINREQLKLVKGLGPKSFQQCAGFIRINPETVNRNSRSVNEDPVDQSKQIVVKKKTQANRTVNKINPLDQTCIHPESYTIAMRFLAEISGSLDHMGSPALRQTVETSIQSRGLEVLAKSLDTTPETLQLIVDGLTQPPGFDIRQNFEKADFKRDILSMSDLHDGMVLTGCVTNTALFGAFVDIGVGRNGLIPNRFINPNKLPVDKRRRSLALGPGDRVEVKIMNVDLQRDRISLDLIKVLR